VALLYISPPHSPLTGEQYGKMDLKYPKDSYCHSAIHPQGNFEVPLFNYFSGDSSSLTW